MKVLRISKSTYSAITETDPRNLIFDSGLNHLKTSTPGSFSRTLAGGANTVVTVAHGLGINPLAMAYFNETSNSKWLVSSSVAPSTSGFRYSADVSLSIYCDTTNVYFKLLNGVGSSRTVDVEYEIFYEGDV